MLVVGESAGKHITNYSSQFQAEFVALLSRRSVSASLLVQTVTDARRLGRYGTKRVKANNVYQEYIQDKHHVHMNSTRWVTLTEFVKHLGRLGIGRVDETEKGWFIAWVDNSPKALAKAVRAFRTDRQALRLTSILSGTSSEEREAHDVR